MLPLDLSTYWINEIFPLNHEARCSSVVRAFADGAMGHWIDPSWGGPIELFLRSSQCSTTGITNAVVCIILSVG